MNKKFQHIHTKQIDEISGGDNDFKIELIKIFQEQIPDFITNMTRFLADANWEKLAREAHTAKSSVLTFGMESTGILLRKIQTDIQANQFDKVNEMTQQAIKNLTEAIPELEELKKQL